MESLLNILKSVFDARTSDQRDALALARFQGVCDAFEQLRARMPRDWPLPAAGSGAVSERALVFYALAMARMRLAEQLHVALHQEVQSSTRTRRSQARLDLEDLTSQIDLLTLAAGMELAQPGSTAGAWETEHRLRDAINPPPPSERGEDTIAHARAMSNGAMVILTDLQGQLREREQSLGAEPLATARMLLSAAQHEFDTLGPLVAQLPAAPTLFAPLTSALHEEVEAQVEQMVRLLQGAAAELAVPNITRTPFWNEVFGDPRGAATVSSTISRASARDGGDRPWERDIWCMTSDLFERTHCGEARANRVLRAMWDADPDPAATWRLYQSVRDLEREGALRRTGSYFNACPWTPIWRAEQTVRVGNKVVRAGQEFCLHIESEPDGSFNREVIVADFRPTDEIDYCDTDEARHHDE